MRLKDLLKEKRSGIIDRWCELTLETYPEQSARFFKTDKNKFSNPVGVTLREGIEILFDGLLNGPAGDRVGEALSQMVKIRAIQDFSASQAVSFIFFLRTAIRESLEQFREEPGLFEELVAFESEIDELALGAFDIYMQCREQVYQLKVNEVRNRSEKVLERFQARIEARGRK